MEAEGNAGQYPGVVNRNACWRMIVTRLGVGAAPAAPFAANPGTGLCLRRCTRVVRRSRVASALASFALVSCVALAGPAIADPYLTQDETDFIGAVAPQGYSGDVYGTVRTGHEACSMLDQGLTQVAIERFVVDTFSDRRQNASYYASVFLQYAAYHLCPRHIGEFGSI